MNASTSTFGEEMFPEKKCKIIFALILYCKNNAGEQVPLAAVDEILQTMTEYSAPPAQINALLGQLNVNNTYTQWYHDVKERDSKEWEDLAHKAYNDWIERTNSLHKR